MRYNRVMTEARTVNCIKYGPGQPGLDYVPYPGELGQRIYDEVSVRLWDEWLAHQTKLINENRWSVRDPVHRARLEEQMRAFLFDEGQLMDIAGYVPPDAAD